MATRMCRTGLVILALLLIGLSSGAQPPDLPRNPEEWAERARKYADSLRTDGFVRYHDYLDPGNLVILGRIKGVSATRKKRIAPTEVVQPGVKGELGRGIVAGIARYGRSNFFHARGKSLLSAEAVLLGSPPSDKVQLRYKVQAEKSAQGKTTYVMLGDEPTHLEKSLYGLWILKPEKKPRGAYSILRLIAFREKPDASQKALLTFRKNQEDYFEVNAAIRLYSDVIEAAQGFYEAGKLTEAVTILQEALKDELKIRSLAFEDRARTLVKPYRTTLEKLLKKLKEKMEAAKKEGQAPGSPKDEKTG